MAYTFPDKISDPLKKWCVEQKGSPDYYKEGMDPKDMLSFVCYVTPGVENNAENEAIMTEVLDKEPETWPEIKKYGQIFCARASGVPMAEISLSDVTPAVDGESKTEPTEEGIPRRNSMTRARASSFRADKPKAAEVQEAKAGEGLDQEISRYSRLYDNYMALDFNRTKVKRTGWTKIPADYKVLCCGNSGRDLCYITLCFLAIYVVLALSFYLLLEAYLSTQKSQSTLYVFCALLVIGWIVLLSVVHAGNKARARAMANATEEMMTA